MSATPDSETTTSRRRSSPRPDGWVDANIALPPELKDALETAAAERAIGVHVLAEKALSDYLSRLVPVDEVQWVRPLPAATPVPRSTDV